MAMSDVRRPEAQRSSRLGEGMLVGLFVGGRSSRMGRPKGLLRAPDGASSLVARSWKVLEAALPGAPRFLVGDRPEYEPLGYPALGDAVHDAGPLGGLVALLRQGQATASSAVIAIACDMPYFESGLVQRLATCAASAPIVAPLEGDHFQPLFARYAVSLLDSFAAALAQRRLSLQPLLRASHAAQLPLSPGEYGQLRDWDSPADIQVS